MKKRYFIGHDGSGHAELLYCVNMPTETSHGTGFRWAVGPFRTKRGALTMLLNPGIQTVTSAEWYAKRSNRHFINPHHTNLID